MELDPAYLPLSERMSALREASQQHQGDIRLVPAGELAQLGYVRIENPDGATQHVPVEKVASDALALQIRTAAEQRQAEQCTAPFEPIQFTVSTKSSKNTVTPTDSVLRKTERFDEIMADCDGHLLVPAFNNVAGLCKAAQDLKEIQDKAEESLHQVDLFFTYAQASTWARFPETDDAGLAGVIDHSQTFISHEESSALWMQLERLKSHLTDIDDVLEPLFATVYGTPSDHVDHIAPMTTESYRYRIEPFATILNDKGFNDIAASLLERPDIDSVRATVATALRENKLTQEFKVAERALKERRRTLTDEADIHQHARQLSELRKAHKQQLQPLHALNDYLQLPTLFATTMRTEITNIQKDLAVASSGSMKVALDSRYDAEKDRDTGAISGDCTAGDPLPFDKDVGAHNIKVALDGVHRGTIYLLATTDQQGVPTWHLDAIQIPANAIDWDAFADMLIGVLSPAALAAGVEQITINTSQHHVSNYDYIAKAFMRYAGTEHLLEGVVDQAESSEPNPQLTSVIFPDVPDRQQFQGAGSEQCIIWHHRQESVATEK
jgi:hypothetical protein